MNTKKLSAFLIATLLVAGTAIGCDNRSQLEKDADKAMGKMEKDAGKAMKNMEAGASKALDKVGN